MSEPAREGVERFEQLVGSLFGLKIAAERRGELAELLDERLAQTRAASVDAYLARLAGPAGSASSKEERDALVGRLTVNETYFFREPDQLAAFIAEVLPGAWARARAEGRPLRLLSAGASTGDEAYSLAILTREALGAVGPTALQIVAIDLNAGVLEKARRGRYSAWSLRQTPAAMRQRYFTADGGSFELDPQIRALVRFEQKNLNDDDPAFWAAGAFDAIFCRNVFIYFSHETMRRVLERFERAVGEGGALFLGTAETLRDLPTRFVLAQTARAFFYRRGAGAPAGPALPPPALAPLPVQEAPPEPGAWVEAVERSARRISELAIAAAPAAPAPPPARALTVDEHLEKLGHLALFRDERYGELLDRLAGLPLSLQSAACLQILRGAALVGQGQTAEAEGVCRAVLALDGLNPEAHFLLGLCRDARGDRDGALAHHQTSAQLDPSFAMPRLHLGLLCRRAGNLKEARGHLASADRLLTSEEPERLVLFGGGFTRDGVRQLCRAELVASGGA